MKRNHKSQTTDKSPMPRDARRHMRATTGLVLYIEEVLYGNYVLTWFDSWWFWSVRLSWSPHLGLIYCTSLSGLSYIFQENETQILYLWICVFLSCSWKGFLSKRRRFICSGFQGNHVKWVLSFLCSLYCFRDWVSVFGFQFLNFNEMIERRARKDSPL